MCDYKCENKYTFEAHVIRLHTPKTVIVKKRIYKKRNREDKQCSICPFKGSALSIHWKSEHPEESLPFLCHLCDHRSCHESYLKHHIR